MAVFFYLHKRVTNLKTLATCGECFIDPRHPSFERIVVDFYENATANFTCRHGHKLSIVLQNHKFELLLESAANALIEGYTLEAASSLSAAYERFFEFAINVYCKKYKIEKNQLEAIFKQVSRQSERQIGAFLFLHLLVFGNAHILNQEIPPLRNKIIHRGYIPTPSEVKKFGEMVYQEILQLTTLIKRDLQEDMMQVAHETVAARSKDFPKDHTPMGSSGVRFFNIGNSQPQPTFHEALERYKTFVAIDVKTLSKLEASHHDGYVRYIAPGS